MKHKIGIIGLGYVGLPLSIAFSKKYEVIGIDNDRKRIKQLTNFIDHTNEVKKEDLRNSIKRNLKLSFSYDDAKDCNIYIITVPTPITKNKKPDLSFLLSATKSVGKLIKQNDIVIYESTVYPGCTEEVCVPVLEKTSGLKYNKHFSCGYSPERINPGDKINKINTIVKVTSGSSKKTASIVNDLYLTIVDAGTHLASSIKIAEASKAIENAQRDLNISFVNELAIIFDKMNIDTTEVLEAASTKWNFLNFKPGLVGGHCISVDPYYLTYASESLGYSPEVILSGRRVNDQMGDFVAKKLVRLMRRAGIKIKDSKVLILGITYKEDCPDTRNTKIPEVHKKLKSLGVDASVYDPNASSDAVYKKFNIRMIDKLKKYDGVILAVSHSQFRKLDIDSLKKHKDSIIFDIKSFLKKQKVNTRL